MKILVAVSGGIDSIVLLDILANKKLDTFLNQKLETSNQQLAIAHFNHAIHSKADAHQKFVEQLAEKYELDFFTEKSKRKLKNEAEAREARYAFFEKILDRENYDVVALAHHAGDQSETILLNLIRGSGMRGLSGMSEFTPLDNANPTGLNGRKWRPLLQVPKSKIESYAKKHKLKFVTDPTNREMKYSRNFLRKKVLPELEKLNPKIEEALLRTAKLARENSEWNELFATEWLNRFSKKKSVELAAFNSLPQAIQRELIRVIYLQELGNLRRIEEKHVEEILRLAKNPRGNKTKKIGAMAFRTAKQGGVRILAW